MQRRDFTRVATTLRAMRRRAQAGPHALELVRFCDDVAENLKTMYAAKYMNFNGLWFDAAYKEGSLTKRFPRIR